jgi:hypothetical protein
MAIPIAPFAGVAARYGLVAVTTYAIARRLPKGRRDQVVEDKLDEVEEGVTLRQEPEQLNLTARMRRLVRLGRTGPGVEVDASLLARVRLKWVRRK